jgi:hypothetical protein
MSFSWLFFSDLEERKRAIAGAVADRSLGGLGECPMAAVIAVGALHLW